MKQDDLESLREKLNHAITDEKSLISNDIVELSQQLDELIVLECKSKSKKKVIV